MRVPSPARKPDPFPLFEAPAGFDDPLSMLLGCHRRIEKKLATLKALSVHLRAKGIDAEASVAAQGVLRYFNAAAPHHHADEEADLFPLLRQRIGEAGERERFAQLDARLRAEHRELENVWARLRRPLEGIGEGLMRTLSDTDVQAFLAIHARHIAAEDAHLVPLVQRWLTREDLEALGRSMATRRGAEWR